MMMTKNKVKTICLFVFFLLLNFCIGCKTNNAAEVIQVTAEVVDIDYYSNYSHYDDGRSEAFHRIELKILAPENYYGLKLILLSDEDQLVFEAGNKIVFKIRPHGIPLEDCHGFVLHNSDILNVMGNK